MSLTMIEHQVTQIYWSNFA